VTTPLDALANALCDVASHNPAAEAPPAAIVWCDANREFEPLIPALRERLPELLTYGDLDLSSRTDQRSGCVRQPSVHLTVLLGPRIRPLSSICPVLVARH